MLTPLIRIIIRFTIGILILLLLFFFVSPAAVIQSLRSINPIFLIGAVMVYSITFFLLTIRWRMIIEYLGYSLPFGTAYQAFAGGVLYSDFTPARVGDFTRAILIKDKVYVKTGIISVIIDRYIDIVVIIGLSSVGIILLSFNISSILPDVAFSLLASIFFVFGIFLIWPSRTLSMLKKIPVTFVQEWITYLNDALPKLKRGKYIILKGIAITLLAWVTHASRLFLIALGLGYTLPVPELFLILPLISALSLIPITISGLGLVEGGLTAVITGYGVPVSVALSIAILDRGLTMIFHCLAGGRYAVKKIL